MNTHHLNPQPVVVVEPRHNPGFAIGLFATRIIISTAFTFLYALIAWWLGPIVFPDHYDLTYWQTFALIYLARTIIPRARSFEYQSNSTLGQPKEKR